MQYFDWRSMLRSVPLAAALAGIFGLLAFFGIELTRTDGRIAAVWLPNALLVAVLLRSRPAVILPALLLAWPANIAANLLQGDTLGRAVGLASANALECAIALLLVIRLCGLNPNMRYLGQLLRLVAGACLVAPPIAALLATLVLDRSGLAAMFDIWWHWAMADAMGMLLILPTSLIIFDAIGRIRRPTRAELLRGTALFVGGVSVTVAVFSQTAHPLLFLVAPVVMAHAFLQGTLGTALSVIKVAIIAIAATALGYGPLAEFDDGIWNQMATLQLFLATMFTMGLPVAALLEGRKRMLAELTDHEFQISLLADNATDAVMIIGLNGECRYVSNWSETLFMQPRETLLGSPLTDQIHASDQGRFRSAIQRLQLGVSQRETITYRRRRDDPNGGPVYIEACCGLMPGDHSAGPREIISSARNVTDRHRLEQQLTRERERALDAAEAKSQFLANMSHEIRTPMNGMLGFADLLVQAELPREQQRHAELILQSGRSMMRLLNDILDISKIEAGQVSLEMAPINLRELLESCVRLHSAEAAQKGLTIELKLAENLPDAIVGDSLRMRQILLNLLANAVKFTEHGTVTVKGSMINGNLMLWVTDPGIGIAPERLEAIFSPFETAEDTMVRQSGSTGLGLAISRQLAQLMGGTLEAASLVGRGSCFTLNLPVTISEHVPEPAAPALALVRGGARKRADRVLLVEDHDINRILVTIMLESLGWEVATARNGIEAIEAIEAQSGTDTPFAIVLMDIQMPHCDGYTAARAIRRGGFSADTLPIIALSANAFDDDVQEALDAGMQEHLPKPLTIQELTAALDRWAPDLSDRERPAARPLATIELVDSWHARKREALDAIALLLKDAKLTAEDAERILDLSHKLAGTAGNFGEQELGELAGQLAQALRDTSAPDEMRSLARRVIAAAA